MKRIIFIAFVISLISLGIFSQNTQMVYLSGTSKDDTKSWDFYCTGGRNSGKWTTIQVPSCWELQGFGTYNYGQEKNKSSEKGFYKHSFFAEKNWKGQKIEIVFEGSMTDTEVKINGKPAGEKHQGAFYRFKYDISRLLKYGENNLLEVNVSKMSSNNTVNEAEREADFWIFGGIFRPVYLQIKPQASIERVAINALADGNFYADVFLNQTSSDAMLEIQITDMSGKALIPAFNTVLTKNKEKTSASIRLEDPALWSPEFPNLHLAKFSLIQKGKVIHQYSQRFGFRTVELRKRDGIYVNGERILFKGVNRHSFYPSSGRTTSKELSIQDVKLMKEMNMNAVRNSHYPADAHFFDACDSLGLFVLDELTAWQWPPYDTETGKKLVREMVTFNVNHPCIVLWDNGNEGGFNFELDDEFHKYDPQKRHVIHPWSIFNGTDTEHYRPYNYGTNVLYNGREIFFPTEFLHGLYDGGHAAGLEDHWNLMYNNPLSAGGFLWCLLDEGVVRVDKNDSIDCFKNYAPDGILGPYREKEGSFYAIKEIWSPVFINMKQIAPSFNGKVMVENRYHFTNLNQCSFSWELKAFSPIASTKGLGKISSVLPGQKGYIELNLPSQWTNYDGLYLTAKDPEGNEIFTWSWPIKTPQMMAQQRIDTKASIEKPVVEESGNQITVSASGVKYMFSKTDGRMIDVVTSKGSVGLSNGPVFVDKQLTIDKVKTSFVNNSFLIEVSFEQKYSYSWSIYGNGMAKLEYEYMPQGEGEYFGVSFDYPESLIESIKYLGNGPYRVYKNRMKGVTFNQWDKKYNNTITGVDWNYPEFKGFYSNFYYGTFNGKKSSFTVITETEDLFMRLFTPENPADPRFTVAPYPTGNISFLNGISAIGTKFDKAEAHGPQGHKNMYYIYNESIAPPLKGVLWFSFDEK